VIDPNRRIHEHRHHILFWVSLAATSFRGWSCAAESGQTEGSFPLNKRFQSQMNQARFLADSRVASGFRDQFVIQIQRRSHAHIYAYLYAYSTGRLCVLSVIAAEDILYL
jgi:hypothetical protein